MNIMNRVEAAKYLGISTRTLDRRTREGKIVYFSDRRGARVHYRVADLDAYVKQHLHKN